jgi:hypothetical protein
MLAAVAAAHTPVVLVAVELEGAAQALAMATGHPVPMVSAVAAGPLRFQTADTLAATAAQASSSSAI